MNNNNHQSNINCIHFIKRKKIKYLNIIFRIKNTLIRIKLICVNRFNII